MNDGLERSLALAQLEKSLNGYYPLSEGTWLKMQGICRVRHLAKHDVLYQMGVVPTTFAVVYKGLFRAFASDSKGHQYNKTFFTLSATGYSPKMHVKLHLFKKMQANVISSFYKTSRDWPNVSRSIILRHTLALRRHNLAAFEKTNNYQPM